MTTRRTIVPVFTALASLALVAGCSATQEDKTTVSGPPLQGAPETAQVAPDDRDDDRKDPADTANPDPKESAVAQAPQTITGYTDEAREEMKEENVTEEDVSAVVSQPEGGEKDDNEWELKLGNITVDITNDGVVTDVDKDD